MARIKIITDSTSYVTEEFAEKENVTVVPLNYIFDGETFKEGFKGSFDEFYNKLSTTKLFPSTSQPSAGEFHEAFEEAFKEAFKDYDEIIAIVLSSKLSGTYNSAVLAKNMLEDKKITIIDSENAASNLRFLVEDAVKMAKLGKTSEQIESYINRKKNKMSVYLTADTLEYMSRGGRLSVVQATLGNILNIKPIISLQDGKLELLEKLRGRNKALEALMNKIPADVEKIGVCQILNMDEALKFKAQLKEKFPKALITIDDLGPVLGSHVGPKTLGLCFY